MKVIMSTVLLGCCGMNLRIILLWNKSPCVITVIVPDDATKEGDVETTQSTLVSLLEAGASQVLVLPRQHLLSLTFAQRPISYQRNLISYTYKESSYKVQSPY